MTDKAVHFGGCAANIVFNGKLLNEDFILLGITGKDFDEYEAWLRKNRISTSHVLRIPKFYTSQAHVMTDRKGQQITIFHEGAASRCAAYKKQIKETVSSLASNLIFVHIAPNNRDFMLECITACEENKLPFIFDPGQSIPLFSAPELKKILKCASGLILNEYEQELIAKQMKISADNLKKTTPLLILTQGKRGSTIYYKGTKIKIPALHPKTTSEDLRRHVGVRAKKKERGRVRPRACRGGGELVGVPRTSDPTGCGDAYRAGFLAHIKNYFPHLTPQILEKAGKLGTRIGTACLETVGTQNHKFKI